MSERSGGQQRRVRRRPSLLAELTDEIEPDEPLTIRRRLAALLLLIITVLVLSASVAYVIAAILRKTPA